VARLAVLGLQAMIDAVLSGFASRNILSVGLMKEKK